MSIKNRAFHTVAKTIVPFTPMSPGAVKQYWREYNKAYDWVTTRSDGFDYVANRLSDFTRIPFVETGFVQPNEISHTYAATLAPVTEQGRNDRDTLIATHRPLSWLISHGLRLPDNRWVTAVRTPAGNRLIDINTWGIFKGLKTHFPRLLNDWANNHPNRALFPYYENHDLFRPGDKTLLTVCDTGYKVPVELPWQASKTHVYHSGEYLVDSKKQAQANRWRPYRLWLMQNAVSRAGLPQNRR